MWQEQKPMDVDGAIEEVDEGDELRERLDKIDADLAASKDTAKALVAYREILNYVPTNTNTAGQPSDSVQKVKEESLYRLAQTYGDARQFADVMTLLREANPFFVTIPKARTAKVVRTIIDLIAKVPDSLDLQLNLCREVIEWCNAEKRSFLRQRIQSRLANLLFRQGKYQEAVVLVNRLLHELKKLDDKQLLVETQLIESRIHNALRNVPKAKAALTAARTAGNAIYIAPLVQAELDEMSGTLHCEESDYKTAFSYFLEAYEAFDSTGDNISTRRCLKYMILSKVLQGLASDVMGLVSGKWGVKCSGEDLDAMADMATAAKNRSLEEFDKVVTKHGALLEADLLIKHHITILYDQLLESNLMKIIEPFSCVEIDRVAELIHLPADKVEHKLSQMILDDKLQGILDQGKGHLIMYDESHSDKAFANGMEVIDNLGTVVSSLFRRAQKHLVH